MLDKDFNWCYNHENLFREWLRRIYMRIDFYDLDNDEIFDLWQKAKEYTLEIANSKEPDLYLKIIGNDIITNFNHHFFWLLHFLYTMLESSKNKNLEPFANFGNEQIKARLSEKKIDVDSTDELDITSLEDSFYYHYLLMGQIKSDYDYSLPDGGIKDETETDETITKTDAGTITKTITQTITKADAGTADNNETLLEKLMPIFYGNKEQAEDYIKKIKNKTKDVEIVRYTAQLVNENTISEMSCHRDLYSILHDHRLYNKTESNWNKVISQHLVKKINKQL